MVTSCASWGWDRVDQTSVLRLPCLNSPGRRWRRPGAFGPWPQFVDSIPNQHNSSISSREIGGRSGGGVAGSSPVSCTRSMRFLARVASSCASSSNHCRSMISSRRGQGDSRMSRAPVHLLLGHIQDYGGTNELRHAQVQGPYPRLHIDGISLDHPVLPDALLRSFPEVVDAFLESVREPGRCLGLARDDPETRADFTHYIPGALHDLPFFVRRHESEVRALPDHRAEEDAPSCSLHRARSVPGFAWSRYSDRAKMSLVTSLPPLPPPISLILHVAVSPAASKPRMRTCEAGPRLLLSRPPMLHPPSTRSGTHSASRRCLR